MKKSKRWLPTSGELRASDRPVAGDEKGARREQGQRRIDSERLIQQCRHLYTVNMEPYSSIAVASCLVNRMLVVRYSAMGITVAVIVIATLILFS